MMSNQKNSVKAQIESVTIPAPPDSLNAVAEVVVRVHGGARLDDALRVAYDVRTAAYPKRVRDARLDAEATRLRTRLAEIEAEKAA